MVNLNYMGKFIKYYCYKFNISRYIEFGRIYFLLHRDVIKLKLDTKKIHHRHPSVYTYIHKYNREYEQTCIIYQRTFGLQSNILLL